MLRAIEATLVAEDPAWARQFTDQPTDEGTTAPAEEPSERTAAPEGLRRRRVIYAVLVLAWVALLATGVALASPALTLTAIAILLWAPLACVVASSFRS